MNEKNRRNKQSLGGNLDIIDWMSKHQSSIVARRSNADLASYATGELHRTVTESNIKLVLETLRIRITRDTTVEEIRQMLVRAFCRIR